MQVRFGLKIYNMKLSLLLTGFLISASLLAQKKEGIVIYERKQNMHRNMGEEMRAMIPEFRVNKQMLIFVDQQSLYKALPEEEAPDPFNNRGGMTIKVGGQKAETYIHFGENRKITASDFFGEAFLITDTIKKHDWTLVDETKIIAGFVCKKATTTTKTFRQAMRIVTSGKSSDPASTPAPKPEETEVEAWYAIDLPSPAGPDTYTGLPGVIMKLDIDNGGIVFSALEFRAVADISQLRAPKKGRKVTPEEYNKEVKKIMENMGSGPIQIRSGN